MSENILLIERDGPVVTLTMNRPKALNALSIALEDALKETLRTSSRDQDVRVIILTGAGRAFSAGVDLKELEETGTAARNWLGSESLKDIMRASPVPIIAAVNGFAITGGFELALLCDFILASEDARFADTHARVGLTPSWGMTQLLPRRIGEARARQMSLTGAFVDAEQALSWGLVNEVVAPEALLDRARAIATDIASTDAVTMGKIRDLIAAGAGRPLTEALALEAQVFADHIGTLGTEDIARNRAAVQSRGRTLNA